MLAQQCSDDSIQILLKLTWVLNVWHIGLLDVVLLEYPDKSHNFYDVITFELYCGGSGGRQFFLRPLQSKFFW